MIKKLLKPTADPVFKRIFGQEKEIAIEVINLLIDPPHPVVEIEYYSQELLPEVSDGKVSIVDIRCTDSMNQHFILEIQLINHIGFEQRILLYAAKAYGQQLKRGMKYDKVQPVFLLSIIHHQIKKDPNSWMHRFALRDEKEPNHQIQGIHLIFIELEKRKKLGNFNLENPIDRWLMFLTEPDKLIDMHKFDVSVYPNLLKAVELLDESNYTEAQLYAYDKHLLAVADINQAYMESYDRGYDQGKEETTSTVLAVLKALKENNHSHDIIAQTYHVDLPFIEELAKLI
jgi:predicted transposase/invertase (TIGR01784 family)